jgi:predicted phosphodiesterase
VQRLAESENCDEIVCLGDFFDNSELDSETITAISEIEWSTIPNLFLVGNHEIGKATNEQSSTHIFKMIDNAHVYDSVSTVCYPAEGIELVFLPYILNIDKQLNQYIGEETLNGNKRIVFSHNDIAGINLGKYITETGLSIDDIENSCDLFINGHLHNGTKITNKIINIGNLTGQNFGEDANVYEHCAYILDTSTMTLQKYTNPHAFNFYKIDVTSVLNSDILSRFEKLKFNSVLTVRCLDSQSEYIREIIQSNPNIVGYRIMTEYVYDEEKLESNVEFSKCDHLKELYDYILSVDFDDVPFEELKEELELICR